MDVRRLALVGLVLACGGQERVAVVSLEPLPSASTATQQPTPRHALLDAGCTATANAAQIDCTHARIDGIGECMMPMQVLSVDFAPEAEIAQCVVQRSDRGVRRAGCMMPIAIRLVAATRDGAVILSSADEVAKKFAPVTSPLEASAFAIALTGNVEPAEVRREGDDYRLRLKYTPVCGCSHPTYGVDYLVTHDGVVKELSRAPIGPDTMPGLCVD